MFSTFVPFEIN